MFTPTLPENNQNIIEYFVCGQCGGKLSLITIEHEDERAYCPECQKTHTGVSPEVYHLAQEYCESHFFSYYRIESDAILSAHLDRGKMCDIIRWLKPRLAELDLSPKGSDE